MASLLRPEVKFDGIDPLVKQMNEDKAQAKHLLSIDFDDDHIYIKLTEIQDYSYSLDIPFS